MHVLAKIRQRALLLVLVAYLAFTNIPSVKKKLLKVDTRAVSQPKASLQQEMSTISSTQKAIPVSAVKPSVNITTSTVTRLPTSSPLEIWQHKRQSLLSKKAAKVVLFAYMRGGSSVGGQLFNVQPTSTLWYEPGDAFYSTYFGIESSLPQNDIYNHDMTRRSPGLKERRWFAEYYTNIFDCHYDRLPTQLLSHHYIRQSLGLRNFTKCINQHTSLSGGSQCLKQVKGLCGTRFVEESWKANCHRILEATRDVIRKRQDRGVPELTASIRKELVSRQVDVNPAINAELANFTLHELCIRNIASDVGKCLPEAIQKCRKDSVRAVKMLRHRIEDLEPLIVANPDLFVIHYVRDPRAIATSRTRTNYLMWDKLDKRPAREAELLCSRIRDDLARRADLEKRYRGVFLQIRYEDLITQPLDVATQVYYFIGKDVPRSWLDYVNGVMRGKLSNASRISGYLNSWKGRIPLDQQEIIKGFCEDVLKALRYPV